MEGMGRWTEAVLLEFLQEQEASVVLANSQCKDGHRLSVCTVQHLVEPRTLVRL